MPDRPVCLITDPGNWEWFKKTEIGQAYVDKAFDDVVLSDPGKQDNKRTHYDSPWHRFTSEFRNGNKHRVFNLTPYDQTLLLDIDYIVQNSSLDFVFDTDSEVTLFHKAESLIGELPAKPQQFLNDRGIPMLWSTAVYFDRRASLTKTFFELWSHIAENYEFYKFLYGFPGTMYRTDFCVSIAAHILNGMGEGELIDDFPMPMINMSQHDDIATIKSIDEWIYLVNDRQANWEDSLTKISGENVHVMNKRAIERHFDTIMALLDGEEE